MAILKRTYLETADLVFKNGFYKEIYKKTILRCEILTITISV